MAANLENIPPLNGWINLTEASELLGFTRQHAYVKARLANEGKANGWKSIRRIGSKPKYVVTIEEVMDRLRGASERDVAQSAAGEANER